MHHNSLPSTGIVPDEPPDIVFCGTVTPTISANPKARSVSLAALGLYAWQDVNEFRVHFMEHEEKFSPLRLLVLSIAKEWGQFANVSFKEIGDVSQAHIRIQLMHRSEAISESIVGNQAKYVPHGSHTMLLAIGGLPPPHETNLKLRHIVLHEFGHALGLVHEHQRVYSPRSDRFLFLLPVCSAMYLH